MSDTSAMYPGVLERVYKEKEPKLVMPDYFSDLNLDQIVKELRDRGEGYDIRSLYLSYPEDVETVWYRQGIYREIRQKGLEGSFKQFSKMMQGTRKYVDLYRKAENEQQWKTFFFYAVREYVQGVNLLQRALGEAAVTSEGLRGLLEYVTGFCTEERWISCMEEIERLEEVFRGLRFRFRIEGGELDVVPDTGDKYYFDYLKQLFPEGFSGREGEYGLPEEYLLHSPFVNEEMLGYLESEIVKIYRKRYPDFFRALHEFLEKYEGIICEDMYRIEEELQFYLVFSQFQNEMEYYGCAFCEPVAEKEGQFMTTGVYDLALARKNKRTEQDVVSNSVQYRSGETFLVVTGPNQGGKTTFARSLGQLVYFAMMGLNVPATQATLPYFEDLLTHFSVEESLESGRGKLKEELSRLAPMMERKTGKSFVILNELFTTAATYDAFIMGQRVLCHFSEAGCMGVYVTHIAEMTKAHEGVVSLVALADENDHRRRTFRVVRKEPDGIGYAGDIVEKHRLGYEDLCIRLTEGGIV